MSDDDIAVLIWKYEKYTITRGEFNKADVLKMPDGTLLNAKRMGIETDTTRPDPHRIIGINNEYEVWGQLPVLQVIETKPSQKRFIN